MFSFDVFLFMLTVKHLNFDTIKCIQSNILYPMDSGVERLFCLMLVLSNLVENNTYGQELLHYYLRHIQNLWHHNSQLPKNCGILSVR